MFFASCFFCTVNNRLFYYSSLNGCEFVGTERNSVVMSVYFNFFGLHFSDDAEKNSIDSTEIQRSME